MRAASWTAIQRSAGAQSSISKSWQPSNGAEPSEKARVRTLEYMRDRWMSRNRPFSKEVSCVKKRVSSDVGRRADENETEDSRVATPAPTLHTRTQSWRVVMRVILTAILALSCEGAL